MNALSDPAQMCSTSLTRREREVVLLIAQGLNNEEIAERLTIEDDTVKKHLKSLFKKLGVHNRTHAALAALRMGLISLDEIEPPEMRRTESFIPHRQQLACLIARGLNCDEIAASLHRSRNTIKGRTARIFLELSTCKRIRVAIYALKMGLITIDEIELPEREKKEGYGKN